MSRANGRRQRQPKAEEAKPVKPGTPEGKQYGISDRVQGHPSPIPGGQKHVSNAPAVRHRVPVPPPDPEIYMGNAHGVAPGSHTNAERADAQRGPNTVHSTMPRPRPQSTRERPQPIPVFVVEGADGTVLRSAAPQHLTVPVNTADPVRLCGTDPDRVEVMLLNESTTTDIRIAQRPSDLNAGGGALLPWPSNSYLTIKTQDRLYAVADSAGTTATISVIQVFERDV